MPRKKTDMERGEKLTFRLAPRYAEKLVEQSRAANVSPNQFARIATMLVAQNGLLDFNSRLGVIEETLVRFKKDFDDAIVTDE